MLQIAATFTWTVLIICLAVLGARSEIRSSRNVALCAVVAWMSSIAATQLAPAWSPPNAWLFAIDFLLFTALVKVSFQNPTVWPAVAAGFQLCAVGIHVSFYIRNAHPGSYYVTLQVASFAVILMICLGLLNEMKASRRSAMLFDIGVNVHESDGLHRDVAV